MIVKLMIYRCNGKKILTRHETANLLYNLMRNFLESIKRYSVKTMNVSEIATNLALINAVNKKRIQIWYSFGVHFVVVSLYYLFGHLVEFQNQRVCISDKVMHIS